jgi:hypothetical protein
MLTRKQLALSYLNALNCNPVFSKLTTSQVLGGRLIHENIKPQRAGDEDGDEEKVQLSRCMHSVVFRVEDMPKVLELARCVSETVMLGRYTYIPERERERWREMVRAIDWVSMKGLEQ